METFQMLPSYTYITIKYQLCKIPLLRSQPTMVVFSALLLSGIVVPLITITLLLIVAFRKAVDLHVRHQLGARYRGQLRGIDAICCNQEACTPSVLLLVSSERPAAALRHDFIERLRNCKRHAHHEKLFFSWATHLGYHYYYRNALHVEDYVVVAEASTTAAVVRSKAAFADLVARCDTAPMPDGGRALLHIVVHPQRIALPHIDDALLVCFRIHHALGDAKAFLNWLVADFGDAQPPSPTTTTPNTDRVRNQRFSLKRTLYEDHITALPTDARDDNDLLGRSLRDEKFICWFSDYSTEYLDKIRTIRKSRPGVTFLDVINTCISSSLQAYYEKHASHVPDIISGGVVLSPAKYSFQYSDSDFTFSNEFSVAGLRFPIVRNASNSKRQEMLEKLDFCRAEYQAVRESVDVQYYYWLSDIFALLPCHLPRMFAHRCLRVTIGVSSLPGADRPITLCGGHRVLDMILMAPNSPGTALHFVNTSYGGAFKIALTIDESVVRSFDDAQEIVDGIVAGIDFLHDVLVHPA